MSIELEVAGKPTTFHSIEDLAAAIRLLIKPRSAKAAQIEQQLQTIKRSAVEPLVQAKTRGEVIEKLGELLAPFGIAIVEG